MIFLIFLNGPLSGKYKVGLIPLSGEFATLWTQPLESHFLIMVSLLSGSPVPPRLVENVIASQ